MMPLRPAAQTRRIAERYFPRARRYRAYETAPPRYARETSPADRAPETERALQCVWYDSRLRPRRLHTTEGEPVQVESPGRWNLGPGPDFLDAAVRIGTEARRVVGDVEVHMRPSDWTAHGHAHDPRYERVRLHVTYYRGPAPRDSLPAGAVQIALGETLAADPLFSFEQIDLAAYPYAAPARPSPCATILARWTPDEKEALLDAAGEERMRRKAERLATAISERGAEQVFYEEFLTALGYPNNKIPFWRLAVQLPWQALRETAGDDPVKAEALLVGAAGLLSSSWRVDWSPAYRRHVRTLWDHWWKSPWAERGAMVEAHIWQKTGARPANHPARRLAGAAAFFAAHAEPVRVLRERADAADAIAAMLDWLEVRADTFWGRHISRTAPAAARPLALIGRDRAIAILINLCVPMLAALDHPRPFNEGWLDRLPPEAPSDRLRAIAHTLFGAGHPPSLYRRGLRRQGLLQIFQDYCLHARSDCAECDFPAWLEAIRAHRPPP